MRSLPRLLLVGLAGVALAAPVVGQRADDQIQPRSIELQHQGKALLAAGKLEEADDVLETALAVDPRNRCGVRRPRPRRREAAAVTARRSA